MSGWGTIRQATAEDGERLEAAARRFITRHQLGGWADRAADLGDALDYISHNMPQFDSNLPRLWRACVRRALRSPGADGIAYGYVGYYAE